MTETTTTSLADGATLLDLSDDGRLVSYKVTANGTDSHYVLDLTNGATTFVASAPNSGDSGHPTGIGGGSRAADRRMAQDAPGRCKSDVHARKSARPDGPRSPSALQRVIIPLQSWIDRARDEKSRSFIWE